MSSGLWEHWPKYFEETFPFKSDSGKSTPLKAPTMKGNILIIFSVLGIGILLSIVCFIIEIGKDIFKFVYIWLQLVYANLIKNKIVAQKISLNSTKSKI